MTQGRSLHGGERVRIGTIWGEKSGGGVRSVRNEVTGVWRVGPTGPVGEGEGVGH